MATTVQQATIVSTITTTENLSKSTLLDNKVEHGKGINQALSYNSGSTPDAEMVYSGTVTLGSGTATLDLTNIANSEGDTIVSTAHKPRAIKIIAASDNDNVITVSKGASNGYTGLGTSFSIGLLAGESFLSIFGTAVVDISGTVKTLDFAGTGSQTCDIFILFG